MKKLTDRVKDNVKKTLVLGATLSALALASNEANAQEQVKVFSQKHVTADNPHGIVTGGYSPNTANYEEEIGRLKGTTGSFYGDQVLNPFIRPGYRDKDMGEREYYGSKDVNGNHIINEREDAQAILDGNTSYRGDVNADGVTNSKDADIIRSVAESKIPYAPSDWNYLTPEERKDYFKKLYEQDNTNTYHEGWGCVNYSDKFWLKFAGLEKASGTQNYDYLSSLINMTTENGLFNLPVYRVVTTATNGVPHAINGILIGPNPQNFYDWYFFEPQLDEKVELGDFSMRNQEGDEVSIRRPSYYYNSYKNIFVYGDMPLLYFDLHNKDSPTLDWKHPDLILSNPTNPVSGIWESSIDSPDIIGNVYPNPYSVGKGELTIPYYGEGLEANVMITDILGRSVYNEKYESTSTFDNKIKIASDNISNLSAGNYNVIVNNKDGKEVSRLVVVK